YFRRKPSPDFEKVRSAAAERLRQWTMKGPFELVELEAQLALEPKEERLLSWWSEMERRFAREQAYGQADTICARLATTPWPALAAAIWATRAGALCHVAPQQRPDEIWRKVLEAPASPRIQLRARLGSATEWKQLGKLPDDLDEGLCASAIAAAE